MRGVSIGRTINHEGQIVHMWIMMFSKVCPLYFSGEDLSKPNVPPGLPVRNWRRDIVTIAPPPVHEVSSQKDKWDVELPWGMPKDSNLIPQHSQDLLRAARSGRLYVRRLPVEEEEVDAEAALGDKPEKKEEDPKEKGFKVKTWKLVPKHQEGPEIEFLAKRRKGLTGTAIRSAAVAGPTITKARVRRTDAAGNTYVEDVVVTEGQALEGEVISHSVNADSATASAVVDGIPAQPTPKPRRPPPPKRRAKGPGRGRKRKLPLAPTSVPNELGGAKVEAETQEAGLPKDSLRPEVSAMTFARFIFRRQGSNTKHHQGKKSEDSGLAVNENENEDTEIGDDALLPSDEEGEDGTEDDEHSDGEGQGDQDDDDEDSTEPNPAELTRTETNGSADVADDNGTGQDRGRDASSSPDLPLASVTSAVGHGHGTAGSPLRNVVTFPPMFEEGSPDLNSDGEAEAEGEIDEVPHENVHESLQTLQTETGDNEMQDAYHMLHDGSMGVQPENAVQYESHFPDGKDGDMMSMDQGKGYIEDDEMLLDGDVSGMDFTGLSGGHDHYPDPFPDDDEEIMSVPVQEHIPASEPQCLDQGHLSSVQEMTAAQPVMDPPEGAREDEEDTFEDLLGSLEDHLNEQGPGPDAETEEAYDNVKAEDEMAPVPFPDQSAASRTTSGITEPGAVNSTQDEAYAENAEMESRDADMDVQGGETDGSTPGSVGGE